MYEETIKRMAKPSNIIEFMSMETSPRNFYFYLVILLSVISTHRFGWKITVAAMFVYLTLEYYVMVNYGFVGFDDETHKRLDE